MRLTLARLLDSSTPANRCLLALMAAVPFFAVYWLSIGVAFLHANMARGLEHGALVALQAFLSVVLLVSLGLGGWLWSRRDSPELLPRATLLVAFNIGLGYLGLLVGTGAFTTGMGLVLLGVLAIGLLLFSVGAILRVFCLCLFLYICQDIAVMAGWLRYAPVLNEGAFDAGGRPMWWWALWQNFVFYMGWVIVLILIFKLFTRLDGLHHQLGKLAHTDVLTGLANRRCFMERLNAESRRHARAKVPYSLVLIDVDHFKSINDRHGHHAGDEVLRRLAQVLVAGVRTPTDQSARIGGEEFAVLLPETSLAAAQLVCERIAEVLRQHTFSVQGQGFHLTVSMGVVECHGEPTDEALKQADHNLYKAKQGGRDQAVYSLVTWVAP